MVVLTDDDIADLPNKSSKEIGVTKFVPADQIDPMWFDKSLLPRARQGRDQAVHPAARRAGQGEADGDLHRLDPHPDDDGRAARARRRHRHADHALARRDPRAPTSRRSRRTTHATKQEMAMATMLIDSLAGDYEPERVRGRLRRSRSRSSSRQVEGGECGHAAEAEESGEVVDLLAALPARSTRPRRPAARPPRRPGAEGAGAKSPTKKTAAKKTAAKKATATKATGEEDRRQEGREEGELPGAASRATCPRTRCTPSAPPRAGP